MKLITRSDFDGLVCAVLLKEVENIEEIEFAHPKDVQDGKIAVDANVILTNLPYVPGCGLWFDHHASETQRVEASTQYKGACVVAPSAARVIYDYYGPEKFKQLDALLEVVDRSDRATLTQQEVLHPSGWILLSYIMDPRTGLGRFHDYTISNRQLMHKIIDWLSQYSAEEILELPDIKERIARYQEQQVEFEQVIKNHSYQKGKVVVTDLRGLEVPAGNRFLIHVWYPTALIALRVLDGFKKQSAVITGGYNIFDKSARTSLGELMAKYGGGGHKASATCQLPYETLDKKLEEMLSIIHDNEK
jgi:nanoRNase/pAp phosphatase (c-di-AMP/oligoRNAs hydrolase)